MVLYVLDGSEPWDKDNDMILELIKDKPKIIIINKSDLPQQINIENLKKITNSPVISLSATKKEGIENLSESILRLFELGNIEDSSAGIVVSNVRHINAIEKAIKKLR